MTSCLQQQHTCSITVLICGTAWYLKNVFDVSYIDAIDHWLFS